MAGDASLGGAGGLLEVYKGNGSGAPRAPQSIRQANGRSACMQTSANLQLHSWEVSPPVEDAASEHTEK